MLVWASLQLAFAAEIAPGVEARYVEHAGERYRVVTIDLRQAHLDLYGQGSRGQPRTIDALDAALDKERERKA